MQRSFISKAMVAGDLPHALLSSLPPEPDEQLGVAIQIVDLAWKSRVQTMEKDMRVAKNASDSVILRLESRISELESELQALTKKFEMTSQSNEELRHERYILAQAIQQSNQEFLKVQSIWHNLEKPCDSNSQDENLSEEDKVVDQENLELNNQSNGIVSLSSNGFQREVSVFDCEHNQSQNKNTTDRTVVRIEEENSIECVQYSSRIFHFENGKCTVTTGAPTWSQIHHN